MCSKVNKSSKDSVRSSDVSESGSGGGIRLNADISEVERTFWLVLDLELSQHSVPADLGYYFECTCEDTFSFSRFQVAAAHFSLYRCHRALKPDQKVLVKYVNAHQTQAPSEARPDPGTSVLAAVLREFELIRQCNSSDQTSKDRVAGVIDVLLVCSQSPNVLLMFLEKPDLFLHEYIELHSSVVLVDSEQRSTGSRSIINRRTTTRRPIALTEARFILGSVAQTLAQLHRVGVAHGCLTANSVFLFMRCVSPRHAKHRRPGGNHGSSAHHHHQLVERVKLANFAFATQFDRDLTVNARNGCNTRQQHKVVQEMMRCKDVAMLYDIAVKVADRTEFATTAEQDSFLEVVHSLYISTEEVQRMEHQLQMAINATTTSAQPDECITSTATESSSFKSTQAKLEYFVEAMWTES